MASCRWTSFRKLHSVPGFRRLCTGLCWLRTLTLASSGWAGWRGGSARSRSGARLPRGHRLACVAHGFWGRRGVRGGALGIGPALWRRCPTYAVERVRQCEGRFQRLARLAAPWQVRCRMLQAAGVSAAMLGRRLSPCPTRPSASGSRERFFGRGSEPRQEPVYLLLGVPMAGRHCRGGVPGPLETTDPRRC